MEPLYKTLKDLDDSIRRDFDRITKALADSPISLKGQLHSLLGFYHGYCAAMNWDEYPDTVSLLRFTIEML